MIRKLLIVAGSALVLAVVALTSAWLIGGSEFVERLNKDGFEISVDEDEQDGPREARDYALVPAQPLVVEVPVHLSFTRGGKAGMKVEGPIALMKELRWENGTLSLGTTKGVQRGGLRVTITGDAMPDLKLRGPGQIELTDLQQPSFSLDVAGAANVEGSGKVETLALLASGAGNLDLAKLEASNASVSISGLGNADLSVTDTLDASISGAGNIDLHRKPKVLNSRIAGIGSIDEVN